MLNCSPIVQVGPPLRNQAVTNQIVTAFSFTLNTNLNTTPRQLVSSSSPRSRVHNPVFKFRVQNNAGQKKIDEFPLQMDNDEAKEKSAIAVFFFCPALSIYIGSGLSGHI